MIMMQHNNDHHDDSQCNIDEVSFHIVITITKSSHPLMIIRNMIMIAHNVTLRFPHCEEAFAQRVQRAAWVSTGTLHRSTWAKNDLIDIANRAGF